MRKIEYHPNNFPEVIRLMKRSENAMKPGANGRVLFNMTRQRFEAYEPHEVDKHSVKDKYGPVYEAVQNFHKTKENPVVTETPKLETVLEEPSVKQIIQSVPENDDEDYEEAVEGDVTLENDVEDVTQNSLQILSSLVNIKQQVNSEHQEKLLAIIGDMFKLDFVSESDILRATVECSELKRVLSHILANFGITVSFTSVSTDFKVGPGTLTFNQNIEYDVQAYRRGALEIAARINEFKDAAKATEEKKAEAKSFSDQLEAERKISADLRAKLADLDKQKNPVRELHSEVPIYYVVGWKDADNNTFFISTDKEAEANKDGSFPTKYLKKTKFHTKAQKFANNEAKAQIAKVIQFHNNVTTLGIEGLTRRQLTGMFNVMRVLVEKVEKIDNEQGE